MADLTLTFGFKINTSVQVGDGIYYAALSSDSGFSTSTTPISLGDVKSISVWDGINQTVVTNFYGTTPPTNGSYIFFRKNNEVNVSSIKGYYGLAKFVNDSNDVGELFSVSCGVLQSSK